MLDKIKTLLGNSYDQDLVELLISQAQDFLLLFCNLSDYDSKYDALIIRMVIEDFNRMGSEGITSKSFNGVSESYSTDPYSSLVMSQLRSYKRIKTL